MSQMQTDLNLNKNYDLDKNLEVFYWKSKAEDIWPWYWTLPIDNNTSIVGMRWRGIKTTNNIGSWIRWKLFNDSLQDWDFRYDPIDRKIHCFGVEYKDFSYIPQRSSTISWVEWEYVLYNWELYKCLDSNNSWVDPITWLWAIWEVVIWVREILPQDNINQNYMIWWYNLPPFAQTIMVDIAPITWWDDLSSNVFTIPWEVTSDWYYIINFFCQVWPREWWTDIYSELTKNTLVIDRCNRYTPTITASSSWWIITTINQWTIESDTLQMMWIWYCAKWDNIDIVLSHNRSWNQIAISNVTLQITRLF